MGLINGTTVIVFIIMILLALVIPIGVSILIIRWIIDYAAKKFADEFSKRNIRF